MRKTAALALPSSAIASKYFGVFSLWIILYIHHTYMYISFLLGIPFCSCLCSTLFLILSLPSLFMSHPSSRCKSGLSPAMKFEHQTLTTSCSCRAGLHARLQKKSWLGYQVWDLFDVLLICEWIAQRLFVPACASFKNLNSTVAFSWPSKTTGWWRFWVACGEHWNILFHPGENGVASIKWARLRPPARWHWAG